MGTFQTIINDPALNAAGENLKVFLQVQETGVHITNGSWAFAGAPGHRFITEGFAAAVQDAEGDIVINAAVKEVIIRKGKVIGVVAEIDGKTMEIHSPTGRLHRPAQGHVETHPGEFAAGGFRPID